MPKHPSAFAILFAALLAATPAAAEMCYVGQGFVASLTDAGRPIHWEAKVVPVLVSLKGAPPGALGAVRRAFADWEEALRACGSGLHFVVRATSEEGCLSYRDQENFVFWGPYEDVARTRTYCYRGRPSVIYGFDIVLNSRKHWGCGPNGRVGYDIESVLAHEIGHVLGLGDVCEPQPGAPGGSAGNRALTMYGWSSCGETLKRVLKEGDRRGVAFLYGQPSLAATGQPSPVASP